MKLGFIKRSSRCATSILKDMSLFKRILLKIKEKGVQAIILDLKKEDLSIDDFSTDLDGLCSMARDPLILSLLSVYKVHGIPIVNDPFSVKKCMDRAFFNAILAKGGFQIPTTHICSNLKSHFNGRLVLKEVLLCRGVRGKGVILTSDSLPSKKPKRKSPVIVQEFLDASLGIKAYVIGGDVYLKRMQLTKKCDNISINLTSPERSNIKETCIKCGELLSIDIFNVEFLRTVEGFFIVDVNDFPSFSNIPDAEERIANYLLRYFKR